MNIFNTTSSNRPKRSLFDLSHERKFSCDMGDIVPIFCQEVLPGDTFRVNSENLIRLAPMLAPMMHRVDVYTHFFYVPNRLVFDKWQDFITGGEHGNDTPVFPFRMVSPGQLEPGSIYDFMGLPTNPPSPAPARITNDLKVNVLPFRALNLIWNEYYRDENLQSPKVISKGEGEDTLTDIGLWKRAWEKDYFTSALPWAQKGDPITIPTQGTADVKYQVGDGGVPIVKLAGGYIPAPGAELKSRTDGTLVNQADTPLAIDPVGTLYADLSTATATTINDLREAFQLQKWLERNARAGSRYTESILAHFGVKSSDARLQRPEYLGGGKNPIVISEVLQNSQSTNDSAQGNMAGHGVGVGNTNSFKAFFEDYGFVIGLMSVMPRTAYQEGLPKTFQKFDKFDYFWPEFAHLGEQEVKMSELYATGTNQDLETFGYQSRYAEYRYIPSTVHGDFRDQLDYWHMGRKFSSPPSLNYQFIECNATKRIFNVTDDNVDHLWIQVYNNVQAVRPMPFLADPGFIDH